MRAALAIVALAACGSDRERERVVPPQGGMRIPVQTGTLTAGPVRTGTPVANPFHGDELALQEGERFYKWFNCDGCHGAIGGGAIGPPLRDRDWIYGASPAQLYHTIVEGRPNGMPAFRGMPEDVVWKLIAYVHSFGGADEQGELAAGQARPPREGEDVAD